MIGTHRNFSGSFGILNHTEVVRDDLFSSLTLDARVQRGLLSLGLCACLCVCLCVCLHLLDLEKAERVEDIQKGECSLKGFLSVVGESIDERESRQFKEGLDSKIKFLAV